VIRASARSLGSRISPIVRLVVTMMGSPLLYR
jgi:hypothetical protein